MLSDALWRELGGDPSIVGKPLKLDGIQRTVIGVMPPGFWFPNPSVRVWLADYMNPTGQSGMYSLVGRVTPGQSILHMQPVSIARRSYSARSTRIRPSGIEPKTPSSRPFAMISWAACDPRFSRRSPRWR